MSSGSLPDFIASTTGRAWTFEPNVPAATRAEEATQRAPDEVQEETLAKETVQGGLDEVTERPESSGGTENEDREEEVVKPGDSHQMSTSEEAVPSVAAPQQMPQDAATASAAVPYSAFSVTQETRSVDDTTQMPGQTELQEIDGPQNDLLFLATAQDPVARLPPVEITYRRPQQAMIDPREPLATEAEAILAYCESTRLEDVLEFRVKVPLLGRLPDDPTVVPRWVARARPSSIPAGRRNVYIPPFRRGRETAQQPILAPHPPPARPLLPTRWPGDLLSVRARPAPAAAASPPANIVEAEARGMETFGIEDICPCNLDGHPCMLPLRCRYRKNIICTTHDCTCPGKLHIPATCDSLRVVGRQCDFGGAGTCWFGHDGMREDGTMETARWDKAREHPAHHRGD